MSGAHSQFRTGNRPLVIDGEPVTKTDNHGRPVKAYKLIPSGYNADGRPAEYHVFETFAVRHVLDYTPAPHFPSKNARGRTRPRTRAEQRRATRLLARFAQLSKNSTLAQQREAEQMALAAL